MASIGVLAGGGTHPLNNIAAKTSEQYRATRLNQDAFLNKEMQLFLLIIVLCLLKFFIKYGLR
ncbi:MAG: hypothetical protein H0W44_09690 [Gammaproteobacteria bacterium]|nr:hypothetical protein [Gammaproteobacteria bacterium]